MKFNPLDWTEVQPNEKIEIPQGRVRLRISKPSPVYVETHGVEALYGVETSCEIQLAQAGAVKVDAPATARVFYALQKAGVHQGGEKEVFTNLDRLPHESGNVLEVTKALRIMKLQERESIRAIRAERARKAAEQEVIEPVPDPAPAPEPAAVP